MEKVDSNKMSSVPTSEYNQIMTATKRKDSLLSGHRQVLGLLAKRAPLIEILHVLVSTLEAQSEGLLCSILLVDEKTQTFRAAVDVGDAKSFSLEISGVSILPPYAGPCCKAANQGENVVVENIASDSMWGELWRSWALKHELKSCHSYPIYSSTGTVLGTFALYHKSFAEVTVSNLYEVEFATYVAGIAIERKLLEAREGDWREKIQRINSELSQSVKLRDDVLSIASHELNSPLATMKMRTTFEKECLLEGGEFDRAKAFKLLESYDSQIDRVLMLISNLTDASYLENHQQSLNVSHLDLGFLVKGTTDRLRPLIQQAGCAVSLDISETIKGVWDPVRLEQVLTNLLMNAVKYGGKGRISVQVSAVKGKAQLSVQDEGAGIHPEDQEKIFLRYEKGSRQNLHTQGLGLGLYIVREIVQAHKGDIRVESLLGKGSKFIVTLPLDSQAQH